MAADTVVDVLDPAAAEHDGGHRPARVLLVEDTLDVALPMTLVLERAGFDVTWTPRGRAALARMETTGYDAIVLDLGLPDMDGREVCRALRARGFEGALLVATARTSPSDRIAGLDDGADDYLAKPFRPEELAARIRAVLRRTAPALADPRPAGDQDGASR